MARPIGSKNRNTTERERLSEHLIEGGIDRLISELNKLEGIQYVNAYVRLLEFFMPKLKRVEDSTEKENEIVINFMDSF